MDQEPTSPIQVDIRRLFFSDSSLINNPGIKKIKYLLREKNEPKA